MFNLILAIVTSAMISILMRLSGDKTSNNIALLAVNYLSCAALAALYTDPAGFGQPGMATAAAMAVVNGILYLSGFVMMQWNIPKNGVVLTSTYMRLGLIVCMALSVVLFGEIPTGVQLAGFCLAVGAILLNGGGNAGRRFQPGLILMLVTIGVLDTWLKFFNTWCGSGLSDQFLLVTFLVAAALCLGMMVCKKQRIGIWELVFGVAIALPNYYNSRFLLLALQSLPGIIVYPTFSVATLLTITVLGICLFRERLNRRQWASMGLILVSLALLNL